MSVSFNTIPKDLRVPLFYAEMDNSAANTATASGPALIIGIASTGSTIVRNKLTLMPSVNEAKSQAGRGSQLARMVDAYRNVDSFGELWVIAVDEPAAGVVATGTVTITGTATESGTMNLYIGDTLVQSAVTANDTAATVATALAAAINANLDLPVTAAAVTGVVTLTSRHKGIFGNEIPVTMNYRGRVGNEATPAGLTATVVAMASGTAAPDLTAAIAAMGDNKFDYIGLGFNDSVSIAAINTEMNDSVGRWSPYRKLYGHAYTSKIGSLSTLVTFGDTMNLQHITVCGYEAAVQTAADELTGYRLAREAIFLRADPARPTQTGELGSALPAPESNQFTISERNSLLSHGIATAYAESGVMYIERSITTYKKNKYGIADNSYLDSETLHQSATILRRLESAFTSKYPRHKLANDGTRFGAGQAIVTPNVIRAEICSEYRRMELEGLVENFELFKKYLIVERSTSDPNRVNVLFPPDYVNQFRVLALLNQFRLQYDEAA